MSEEYDHLLLIVVGAHLRAEAGDRPLAYQLQHYIEDWMQSHTDADHDPPVEPVLCTDVWYLNNEELHNRPVISVGGPGVNALSAYLYQRLTTALAIENQLVVQLDVEMTDLRASLWGVNREASANAIDLFQKKYMPDFLHAAATQVEPDFEWDD